MKIALIKNRTVWGMGRVVAVITLALSAAAAMPVQLAVAQPSYQGGTALLTITTQLFPTVLVAGGSAHDTATLHWGDGPTPTGTVTYNRYPNSTCTGNPDVSSTVDVGADGSVPDAPSYLYSSATTAYWVAVYNGEEYYASASSGCAAEPLLVLDSKLSPTITTQLEPSDTIAVGDYAHDNATLNWGKGPTPTGTVTYKTYPDDHCGDLSYSQTVNVAADGSVPDSPSNPHNSAGTVYWVATYSGDAIYNGESSFCAEEPLTINQATPTISTKLSTDHVFVGQTAYDSATLSGGFNPTGTVTYVTYNTLQDCAAQTNAKSTGSPKQLNGAPGYTLPDSDTVTFSDPGRQYWVATYSGDNNNVGPISSGCSDEPIVIDKLATITIVKVTEPNNPTQPFHFTGTGEGGYNFGGGFALINDDGDSSKTFSDLIPGTYTVTEDDSSGLGYLLTELSCSGDSGTPQDPGARTATINLGAGENVECRFTNTLRGTSGVDKTIWSSNQSFTTEPGVTVSPFSSLQDVAIGEIVEYATTVHLPYGDYYKLQLVDTMDQGLAFVDCFSIEPNNTSPISTTGCTNPTFNAALPDSVDYKRIVTIPLNEVHALAGGGSVKVIYYAVVLDSRGNVGVPPPPYPTKLANSAVFQYSDTRDGDPTRQIGTGSVTVEVVEPQLQITKEADTEFVGLGTIVSFKVTIRHTPNSHTPAFDVVMTDPIPSQFDYYADLDCSDSTNPPDAPVEQVNADVITAGWSEFDIGDVGVCTFKLQANDTWSVGTNVTNVASVVWTSLPGVPAAGAGCPADTGKQNCGDFSTERNYDPNDPSINNYIASSDTPFEAPGGGEREGKGKNFQLPGTGFAPGVVTALTGQPAVAYNDNLGVNLRIPKLKLNMAIEGVPYLNDVWQVDWLTGVGGWLQGTAFPGLSGNSVIMSHVVTRYGAAGPFARLNALNLGDNIYVTSLGRTYVYQVKKTGNVAADDISVLKHAIKPVLTLITCSQWNEATQTYDGRYVVYAELIQ